MAMTIKDRDCVDIFWPSRKDVFLLVNLQYLMGKIINKPYLDGQNHLDRVCVDVFWPSRKRSFLMVKFQYLMAMTIKIGFVLMFFGHQENDLS